MLEKSEILEISKMIETVEILGISESKSQRCREFHLCHLGEGS